MMNTVPLFPERGNWTSVPRGRFMGSERKEGFLLFVSDIILFIILFASSIPVFIVIVVEVVEVFEWLLLLL